MASQISLSLIGKNHSKEFLQALSENPQCVTTHCASFAEYNGPVDKLHAVVFSGHDDALTQKSTISTLLDRPILLVFFSPTKKILNAIQAAAVPVISLPDIQFEEGVPLLIHKRPNDGVISITPGYNSHPEISHRTGHQTQVGDDSEAQPKVTPLATVSNDQPSIIAHTVHVIEVTYRYLQDLLKGGTIRAATDGLTPPPGTNWWKTTEVSYVPYRDAISNSGSGAPFKKISTQYFDLVARVSLHMYCANAKPTDPNFQQNGGVIYVVAVHRGQSERTPGTLGRQFEPSANDAQEVFAFLDRTDFGITIPNKDLSIQAYDPRQGSTSGQVTNYRINFDTTFNLWQNNGTKLFAFEAKYADAFDLNQFKQSVYSQGSSDFTSRIYYDNYYTASIWPPDYYGDRGYKNVWDQSNPNRWIIKAFPDDYIPLNGFAMWKADKQNSSFTLGGTMYCSGFVRAPPYNWWAGWTIDNFNTYQLDLTTWDL
ncbi:hypothetical protein AX16_001424 [Volvariella volvacea WC 439]|nr:hypothetical protein AX16_001424 [Volvariella volvacea WC 439]